MIIIKLNVNYMSQTPNTNLIITISLQVSYS